ncbi:DUF349 domain-containing protein [Undibacterium arcticum]|uniref:DUF349 domain-containing protein n=1 Tax=Undibacterium arcticum TaxID=1762892 RepID=A0ABV7EZH2_9BURK
MFDFLFKRTSKNTATKLNPSRGTQQTAQPQQSIVPAVADSAKQAALAQAQHFENDEAAAVAFIQQNEFADARLKAAQYVHSEPMLEQLYQAMRNADRRVAKLMQTRLDAIRHQSAVASKAQTCIARAQALIQLPSLMPNQVAQLDRDWQSAGAATPVLQESYQAVRTQLAQRLAAQAGLQRAVIDARVRLQRLIENIEGIDTLAPDELARQSAQIEAELAQHRASPEAPSLPQPLLTELTNQQQRLAGLQLAHEQRFAARMARQQALTDWEAADDQLDVDSLHRNWRALPAPDDAVLQARFDTLIARVGRSSGLSANASPVLPALRPQASADQQRQFSSALDAMEQALQDGLLHAAADQDKLLRSNDLKALRPAPAQATRLGVARAELSRLQDWAKWGGNVSREELIKAVEDLAGQNLPVTELAKKVGSSRERWRALDTASGAAPKNLWERFDSVCTTAYAPAAAHFKQLAEQRQENAGKARMLIAELVKYADDHKLSATVDADPDPDSSSFDWKGIAAYCQQYSQAWHQVGPLDRKEKRTLQAEFDCALRRLMGPLTQQRQHESAQREKLIAEVTRLDPDQRSSVDQLRALQERWQQHARSLPLDRHEEQALWQRFRSACDAVFAKRKASSDAADAERRQNLQAKEALCGTLEATGQGGPDTDAGSLAAALHDATAAWNRIGPVPRTAERQIEQRHQVAVAALQAKIDAVKRAAAQAQANVLRDKIMLCQQLEAALQQPVERNWADSWQALPAMRSPWEAAMRNRFDAALRALQAGDADYVRTLQDNQTPLAQQLLRLEIVCGLASPAALSGERLKMQVEVLQSSLKSGQREMSREQLLQDLFSLPAQADAQTTSRMTAVMNTVNGSEPGN